MARFFNTQQRSSLTRPLAIAEDAIGDYYHISRFDLHNYPYDVMTSRDMVNEPAAIYVKTSVIERLPDDELEESHALAQVLKLKLDWGPLGLAPWHQRPHHIYRIAISDENILQFCEAHAGVQFETLMTYIFAHELIHIIRFEHHAQRFDASKPARLREEQEVHRITCLLLRGDTFPSMDLLARKLHPE